MSNWSGKSIPFSSVLYLLGAVVGYSLSDINIIQSTRGIIAVILGAIIAKFAWSEHEEKLSRSILIRRIASALLISCAIVIFVLAKK